MAKIPSRLEDLLPVGAFERVLDALHRPELSQKVREAVSKVGLKEINPLEQAQEAWQQARSWLGSLTAGDTRVNSQLINATGSLLQSDADYVPSPLSVTLSLAKASSTFTDRQHCLNRSSEIVATCLGAKHHIWLSEPLAALQIAVQVLGPRGVLIPRSNCVRVPGLGDLRSMVTLSGSSVSEVGATNGATADDWQSALSEADGKVVFTASPNGLNASQAAENRQQLIAAARSRGIPVVELVADGTLDPQLAQQYGFPLLSERLAESDHLTLIPMHFLLGSPRGVLCIGKESEVIALRKAASLLGAELKGSAISANILALQLATLDDDLERGMIGSLKVNPENLRNRCHRLATQLTGLEPIASAEVVESQHPLGSSPWDRYLLSNPIIVLKLTRSPQSVLDSLRAGDSENAAIELKHRGDELSIDLRFVHPDDDHRIVTAFQAIA